MKRFSIPFFNASHPSLDEVSSWLKKGHHQRIDTLNWLSHPYCPAVTVAAGRTQDELVLHYEVCEQSVLAEKSETNQSVCEDSCVECFFGPRPGLYFNIECNPIGTILVGRGADRSSSCTIAPELIKSIRRTTSLGQTPFGERHEGTSWNATLAIPLPLLEVDPTTCGGQTFRANFYKCGDHLSTPHYLSWSPITSDQPDFHRPEAFGELFFEEIGESSC